jgi:hypothetical protein
MIPFMTHPLTKTEGIAVPETSPAPGTSSVLPELAAQNRKVTVNSHIVKHLGISNSYGAHRFG